MSLVGIDYHPEVESHSKHCARKEHVCTECGDKILTGETYERRFTVYDGHASTEKTCGDCLALITKFFDSLRDAGLQHEITYELGNLRYAIIELRQEYGLLVEGFKYPEDDQ